MQRHSRPAGDGFGIIAVGMSVESFVYSAEICQISSAYSLIVLSELNFPA
jgi:hypothetical protein